MKNGLVSYGATEEVTGSKHLLHIDGKKLLIDCGQHQGSAEEEKKNKSLPFNAKEIDALLLTHAHQDHSGLAPYLVKLGFHGPIYTTQASKELLLPLWEDSVGIMKKENNKLYDMGDVKRALKQIKVLKWGQKKTLDSIQFIFHPCSHILGASSIQIKGTKLSILFSGDLGRPDAFIHPSLPTRPQADYVVMESTYGDREHQAWQEEKLIELIQEVKNKDGTLLIAAFAIDRTQILIFLLHQLFKKMPELELPVWLSGRLALRANEVYWAHRKELKVPVKEFKAALKMVKDLQWAKQKKDFYQKHKGPKIVLAASGMVSGGTIYYHLEHLAQDSNSTLLLSGYQGVNTPGRALQEGQRELVINQRAIQINMKIEKIEGLSSHPDRSQLDHWLNSQEKPKKVFLSHGDQAAQESYALHLQEQGLDTKILKSGEFNPF